MCSKVVLRKLLCGGHTKTKISKEERGNDFKIVFWCHFPKIDIPFSFYHIVKLDDR